MPKWVIWHLPDKHMPFHEYWSDSYKLIVYMIVRNRGTIFSRHYDVTWPSYDVTWRNSWKMGVFYLYSNCGYSWGCLPCHVVACLKGLLKALKMYYAHFHYLPQNVFFRRSKFKIFIFSQLSGVLGWISPYWWQIS